MSKRAKHKDPDNPPLTAADFAKMRPTTEVLPELVKAATRGRPRLESPKELVTLRLDADIVKYFRRKGDGWRTSVNDALRKVTKLKKRA